MANLDSLDHALLSALRVDGRAPVAELARALGVTRTTITRRIDALTEAGVILGFTVRVAERTDAAIRAISHLAIEGPYVEETIRMLRGLPEVTALHATNGEWDLVAEITVTKLADVDVVLSAIRNSPGVHRSETSILLRSVLM